MTEQLIYASIIGLLFGMVLGFLPIKIAIPIGALAITGWIMFNLC